MKKPISLYEKRLQMKPDRQWFMHDLAVILKNDGHYRRSVNLFNKIISLYPRSIWHYIGLANAFAEKDLLDSASTVYNRYETVLDTCSSCAPSIMLSFNYSLILSKRNETSRARKVLHETINNPRTKFYAFHNSMLQIIDFYEGNIEADSVEQVMTNASKKLQRQSYFISHYYYLGMAYLYNLKPTYQLTPGYRERAINHLKRYEQEADKDDVEFSLARVELKRLGVKLYTVLSGRMGITRGKFEVIK